MNFFDAARRKLFGPLTTNLCRRCATRWRRPKCSQSSQSNGARYAQLERSCLAAALLLATALGTVTNCFCQAAPAVIGPWETIAVGGTFSAYRLNYGDRFLMGAAVYIDASYTNHYGIEAEARWLWLHQRDSVRDATYLIGPRYTLNGFGGVRRKFRPYLKFEVGAAQFRYPYRYATGSYFVLAPGGGIDYRLNSRLRLRLIDIEYQRWPQFTYGSFSSFGVSSGLRIRLY